MAEDKVKYDVSSRGRFKAGGVNHSGPCKGIYMTVTEAKTLKTIGFNIKKCDFEPLPEKEVEIIIEKELDIPEITEPVVEDKDKEKRKKGKKNKKRSEDTLTSDDI